jgi:glutamate racemase
LVLQPCPGLVDAIEAGNLEAPAVTDLVTTYCARLREAQVDTVVLGCTHYPFVARHIQQAMGPDVMLVDTAHAVARQTANVAKAFSGGPTSCATLSAPTASGTSSIPIEMWTTGPADRLQKVSQEWLSWHYCVSSIAV